jgi:hypothetical protein
MVPPAVAAALQKRLVPSSGPGATTDGKSTEGSRG